MLCAYANASRNVATVFLSICVALREDASRALKSFTCLCGALPPSVSRFIGYGLRIPIGYRINELERFSSSPALRRAKNLPIESVLDRLRKLKSHRFLNNVPVGTNSIGLL